MVNVTEKTKEDMEFTAIAIIHGYAMTNVSRTDADTGSIALRIKERAGMLQSVLAQYKAME